MTCYLSCTLAMVLASGCSAVKDRPPEAAKPASPWFVGVFSGSSFIGSDPPFEVGAGRFELKADGTFTLDFHWAAMEPSAAYDWLAEGRWELTGINDGPEVAVPDAGFRLQPTTVGGALPRGARLLAYVTGDEVLVAGGPCVMFTLDRAK